MPDPADPVLTYPLPLVMASIGRGHDASYPFKTIAAPTVRQLLAISEASPSRTWQPTGCA
jgi:hypothetical protein